MFNSERIKTKDKYKVSGKKSKYSPFISQIYTIGITYLKIFFFFILFIYLFLFYFIFKLYKIVLVLPNINMFNQPQLLAGNKPGAL